MQTKVGLVAVVLLLIGGAFVLFSDRGTTSDASSAVANSQPPATEVPFTKITQGSKSTVATRVNYAIVSTDELKKLWEMVDAPGSPPTVDFTTHTVLAVFAGKEPGATIAVAKIEDTDARMVSITITKPDSTCTKKPSTIAPYELVVVPSTSLPLAHEDISTTASCN